MRALEPAPRAALAVRVEARDLDVLHAAGRDEAAAEAVDGAGLVVEDAAAAIWFEFV